MCCPFLCKLTSQSIETYGKINLAGMCSHPINANRLRCHTKKWADMGTFNTKCINNFCKEHIKHTEMQFFGWWLKNNTCQNWVNILKMANLQIIKRMRNILNQKIISLVLPSCNCFASNLILNICINQFMKVEFDQTLAVFET